MEDNENHKYLGDGVYLETNPREIILRTGDHRDRFCQNKIVMENNILSKLLKELESLTDKDRT